VLVDMNIISAMAAYIPP